MAENLDAVTAERDVLIVERIETQNLLAELARWAAAAEIWREKIYDEATQWDDQQDIIRLGLIGEFKYLGNIEDTEFVFAKPSPAARVAIDAALLPLADEIARWKDNREE